MIGAKQLRNIEVKYLNLFTLQMIVTRIWRDIVRKKEFLLKIKGKVYESCVRWYGRLLRRKEGNVLREVLNFENDGRRERDRSKST